jgi:hypothetical protein
MKTKLLFLIFVLPYYITSNSLRAQISKQEIITELNSIDNKFHPNQEIAEQFQLGHSTIESENLITDISEKEDKTTEVVALTYYRRFYPDNYSKIIIYLKKSTPIAILKEKKVTVTSSYNSGITEILTSLTRFYVYNWEKWEIEKEIIKDGGFLLESNIDKKEIENIINKSKKE